MNRSGMYHIRPARSCLPWAAALLALSVTAATVRAGELVKPDPGLSAKEVVKIQLDALRDVGSDRIDDNVLQVWTLAHPSNKAYMGTLSRFGAMLFSPGYNTLIRHRSHSLLAARSADQVMEFYVTVESHSGATSAFIWVMEKVSEGDNAGCWMTRGVSPAVELNRSA